MTSQFLLTLPDAIHILTEETGKVWTRIEFYNAVIDQALPLQATTPNGCHAVIEGLGEVHPARLPELGHRRHALLLRTAIRDLAAHGEAESHFVALEPGDPEFMAWPAIKERRKLREHELAQEPHSVDALDSRPSWSHWLPQDFMGESDMYALSEPVKVTDETCRVPAATIEELVAHMRMAKAPPASRVSGQATKSTKHFIKRNSLDSLIEDAIKRAGSQSSPDVWIQLREIALEGRTPFTGEVKEDRLLFTNDKSQLASLSKDALRKRLVKYRSPAEA